MKIKGMRKTLAAAALALALTGALTGCGKKEDKTEKSTSSAATEAKKDTTASTEAATEEATIRDEMATTEADTTKEDETEAATEATEEQLEDSFEGNYYCEENSRVSMTITKNNDNYDVKIMWSDSANTMYTWTFSGKFDGNVLEYANGIKLKECYDENGNFIEDEDGNPTPLAMYKYGTGSLSVGNGGVQWTDDVENALGSNHFRRY